MRIATLLGEGHTDFYAPKHERTIRWDEPMLNINWGVDNVESLILSTKEREGKTLEQALEELQSMPVWITTPNSL